MNLKEFIKLEIWENFFEFKIVPNSKNTKFVGFYGDKFKLKISSPPENNKANNEIIDYLSKNLEINKKNISIISWEHSTLKMIKIVND